jgi:uncharacterized small protein (DUF1192 family)
MMNEKLASLLECVRRTAVQAGDVAADTACSVGKVAGELLSVAKLNVRIMERKAAVNAALKEVGEILYATHTGNPSDSEILLAKLQEIDALKAEIARMQEQIKKEEAARVCQTCGSVIREGASFCGECGEKL